MRLLARAVRIMLAAFFGALAGFIVWVITNFAIVCYQLQFVHAQEEVVRVRAYMLEVDAVPVFMAIGIALGAVLGVRVKRASSDET
jgi:hypothetical protein